MSQNKPSDGTNRLNLFRFKSGRSSAFDDAQDEEQDPMSELEAIDMGQESSFFSSQEELQKPDFPHSNSESSLIFERSVEDPAQVYQPTSCSRCGRNNSKGQCNHQSLLNLPSHFSVENFVSPCLDATTKILTDETTDLDNVEMVYSRRPSSVLGLNLALGRTKSFAESSSTAHQQPLSPNSPISTHNHSQSFANMNELKSSNSSPRPPALSFYSYADMISSENPNPRRPSITQSLSSTLLNSRSNSVSNAHFQTAGTSITPCRNPRTSSFSSPFYLQQQQQQNQQTRSKHSSQSRQGQLSSQSQTPKPIKSFTLNPDSPNSSDSESEYKVGALDRNTSISSKRSKYLQRTSSNQSSLNSRYSNSSRRYLDDALYTSDDAESLVTSSIGEHIRRNTGEIRSRNNSIIA